MQRTGLEPPPVEDVIPSTFSLRQSLSSETTQYIFIGSRDFTEYTDFRSYAVRETGHRNSSRMGSWTQGKLADSPSLSGMTGPYHRENEHWWCLVEWMM